MKNASIAILPTGLDFTDKKDMDLAVSIINQFITNANNRLNKIQQVGAVAPPNVTGFTVAGKQGLFHLVWNRIKNADGYVIVQATDAAMTQLVGRFTIQDGQQCSYQIPVGNVAATYSFQIYAFQGSQYGSPSNSITATSSVYGAAESAPSAPPIPPQQPILAPVRSGPNLK